MCDSQSYERERQFKSKRRWSRRTDTMTVCPPRRVMNRNTTEIRGFRTEGGEGKPLWTLHTALESKSSAQRLCVSQRQERKNSEWNCVPCHQYMDSSFRVSAVMYSWELEICSAAFLSLIMEWKEIKGLQQNTPSLPPSFGQLCRSFWKWEKRESSSSLHQRFKLK